MSNAIKSAPDFIRFITAGNATITIVSNVTGRRFTFKITKAADGKSMFFVKTLVGSDNMSDFEYVGFFSTMLRDTLQLRNGRVLVAGKKGRPGDIRFKALDWLLTAIAMSRDTTMSETVTVFHEGRCARCGRKLTTPESIESGFGPECVKHTA